MRYTDINHLEWQQTDDEEVGSNVDIEDPVVLVHGRRRIFSQRGHDEVGVLRDSAGALRFEDSDLARAGSVVQTSIGERHAAIALGDIIFIGHPSPR